MKAASQGRPPAGGGDKMADGVWGGGGEGKGGGGSPVMAAAVVVAAAVGAAGSVRSVPRLMALRGPREPAPPRCPHKHKDGGGFVPHTNTTHRPPRPGPRPRSLARCGRRPHSAGLRLPPPPLPSEGERGSGGCPRGPGPPTAPEAAGRRERGAALPGVEGTAPGWRRPGPGVREGRGKAAFLASLRVEMPAVALGTAQAESLPRPSCPRRASTAAVWV